MNSKEDFTSIMIHELRSPIDNIKKISEVVRDDRVRNDAKRYAEYVEMIYKSSSYALEIINNLLAIAKIESNRLELSVRPSEIKQIVEEGVRFFDTDAKIADISITTLIGENIPEQLELDPIHIKQALNNLLSNALKFTSTGGHIVVNLLAYKKDEIFSEEIAKKGFKWFIGKDTDDKFAQLSDCIVVGVTDSGFGIPEADITRLFTKFVQLDGTSPNGVKKGIGLGLAVIKGIIEAHGGIVGASSDEGRGSTFYFTINR